MSSITYDCELLRQPWQEKIFAGAIDFKAVQDSLSRPIIFILHRDGSLFVLAHDITGNPKIVDISQKVGLKASDKIVTIAVNQAANLDIYLAFASNDKKVSGPSNLWILPALSPKSPSWLDSINNNTAFKGPTSSSFIISKLLLGSSEVNSAYPFLAAVVTGPNNSKKDVSRIAVDANSKTWKWATDLAYPYNIDNMIDICVGRIPVASGIFGLDITQGKPSLTFAGISGTGQAGSPIAPYNVNLPVVANPKSIATTLDEDGFTNVLICGDGILLVASQNCVDSVAPGTINPPSVSNDNLRGIRKIEVAQQGRQIALWALNGDNNLVGVTGRLKVDEDDCDQLIGLSAPVPLLPLKDQLATFDAVMQAQTLSHQVLCLNQDGSITCLNQNGDSKLWSQHSLSVPDPENVVDVNVYSLHMRVQTHNNNNSQPDLISSVQIKSSSQVSCLANGVPLTIGTSNVSLKTNAKGIISLNIRAQDLVTPVITVTADGASPLAINPALKPMQKLKITASAGKLTDVYKADGSHLFPNVDDHKNQAIIDLSNKYLGNNANPSTSPSQPSTVAQSGVGASVASGPLENLWPFWHGITSGVENVEHVIYEDGVLIVNTAKQVLKFVVDTYEHVLSAITGLIRLLEAAVEDALLWLAEQLDWDVITDVLTIMNETVNTGLDMAQELVEDGGDWIDVWFQNVEDKVGSWHMPPKLPEQAASLKATAQGNSSQNNHDFANNPIFNWLGNTLDLITGQVPTPPALTPSTGVDSKKPTDFSDVLKTLFDEVIQPLWETLKDTFSNIWSDLKRLIDPNDPITWQDVIKNIGVDVLLGVIRALRKVVRGLAATASTLFAWIKNMLNEPQHIWIVSKVFLKETKRQLTTMDLGALLLAVPTAYAFKILVGKKPREIPSIKELLDDISSGKAKPPQILVAAAAQSNNTTIASSNDANNTTIASSNDANKISNNWDSQSWLQRFCDWCIYLWRLGFLIKTVGVVCYNLGDTIVTAVKWKKTDVVAASSVDDQPGWTRGAAVYLAIFLSVTKCPIDKLNRSADCIELRFAAWGITSGLDIYKAVLPKSSKPVLAAMAGTVDVVFYSIILSKEGIDKTDKTDTVLELLQRYLSGVWAIGSSINGTTNGNERITYFGTIAVGAALNIEGGVLAEQNIKYFSENSWNADYHAPSIDNSLNGSLM